MKVHKYDGSREKAVLTGMVTSTPFLARLSLHWSEGLFRSPMANLVGKWCMDYYREAKKAPSRHIKTLFGIWAETAQDEPMVRLVDRFLAGLSEEYEVSETLNVDQLLDWAGKLFRRTRLTTLRDRLEVALESNDLDKAEQFVASHSRLDLGIGQGIKLFHDEAVVRSVFEGADQRQLIQFPGALGEFFGRSLSRDCFLAFFAGEKMTKSLWLMHLAIQAILQRRRVAFFEVGDMSLEQVAERFLIRISKTPNKPCTVKIPIELEAGVDGEIAFVQHRDRVFSQALTADVAWEACQSLMRDKVKSRKDYLRLSVHPNSSIDVAGIEAILQEWEQDDFLCDICIIDYVDILAPPAGKLEYRDQINTTWKQLRALSQRRHCLVLTASQADAASYSARTLSRRNFSEDKRKLSHVTGVIGINATPEEQELGVQRLNWIVRRAEKGSPTKCVTVATCLDLCNPAMRSAW